MVKLHGQLLIQKHNAETATTTTKLHLYKGVLHIMPYFKTDNQVQTAEIRRRQNKQVKKFQIQLTGNESENNRGKKSTNTHKRGKPKRKCKQKRRLIRRDKK